MCTKLILSHIIFLDCHEGRHVEVMEQLLKMTLDQSFLAVGLKDLIIELFQKQESRLSAINEVVLKQVTAAIYGRSKSLGLCIIISLVPRRP